MKTKIFLTSIIALGFTGHMSFAGGLSLLDGPTGINDSSTCDTETLGQSENNSTANLEATWDANVININWFDGNEQLIVSSDASYCMYDDVITLPQEPTKTGYTFNGWRLSNRCSGVNNSSDCNNINGCQWDLLGQSCMNAVNNDMPQEMTPNYGMLCQAYQSDTNCLENANCNWNSGTNTCESFESMCNRQTSQNCAGNSRRIDFGSGMGTGIKSCMWDTENNKCTTNPVLSLLG